MVVGMDQNSLKPEPSFAGLGLRAELLRALSTLGYEEPTPIQREAIPALVAGHDVVGQAATGTGKTAAFALPVLQGLTAGSREAGPAALILVPTRELAEQVSQAVHRYGRDLGVRVLPVYGGQPIGRQLQALQRGVDVVVGTPGRVLDHIDRATLRLGEVRTVVLDEADEMLDMGFAEDIEAILAETPEDRQTVLFSATMPPRIDSIARRHLRDPVRIAMGRAAVTAGELVQGGVGEPGADSARVVQCAVGAVDGEQQRADGAGSATLAGLVTDDDADLEGAYERSFSHLARDRSLDGLPVRRVGL